MTITATAYGTFLQSLGRGSQNLAGDTIKFSLLKNTYTPDYTNHTHFSDVQAAEITGDGTAGAYVAGGATLANQTYTYNSSTGIALLTADPIIWSNFSATFRYGVIYNTSSAAANSLIACIDYGQDQSYTATALTMTFSNGVVSLGRA